MSRDKLFCPGTSRDKITFYFCTFSKKKSDFSQKRKKKLPLAIIKYCANSACFTINGPSLVGLLMKLQAHFCSSMKQAVYKGEIVRLPQLCWLTIVFLKLPCCCQWHCTSVLHWVGVKVTWWFSLMQLTASRIGSLESNSWPLYCVTALLYYLELSTFS